MKKYAALFNFYDVSIIHNSSCHWNTCLKIQKKIIYCGATAQCSHYLLKKQRLLEENFLNTVEKVPFHEDNGCVI